MHYSDYSDYSDTDRFLDELFAEDAELGWSCNGPQNQGGVSIVIAQDEDNSPESQYIKSLVAEIKENLDEIANNIGSIGDNEDTGCYFTKENVVQRVIEVSNSVNSILKEFEQHNTTITVGNASGPGPMAVIGGGFPSMF